MRDKTRFCFSSGGCWFTALEICRSAAGYYIGRMGWEEDWGYAAPYTRESGYYKTAEAAQQALDDGTFVVRDCAENNVLYRSGALPYPKGGPR
jgi:hypothetical protein